MECDMSIKIHFSDSQSDFFPENCGAVSDKFPTRKKIIRASGAQVCWLTAAEPSRKMLHRRNTAQNQPESTFR